MEAEITNSRSYISPIGPYWHSRIPISKSQKYNPANDKQIEYTGLECRKAQFNDRQKSGSPIVNSSMTFTVGHFATEILARRESETRAMIVNLIARDEYELDFSMI